MSRTDKDTPFGVLASLAAREGFLKARPVQEPRLEITDNKLFVTFPASQRDRALEALQAAEVLAKATAAGPVPYVDLPEDAASAVMHLARLLWDLPTGRVLRRTEAGDSAHFGGWVYGSRQMSPAGRPGATEGLLAGKALFRSGAVVYRVEEASLRRVSASLLSGWDHSKEFPHYLYGEPVLELRTPAHTGVFGWGRKVWVLSLDVSWSTVVQLVPRVYGDPVRAGLTRSFTHRYGRPRVESDERHYSNRRARRGAARALRHAALEDEADSLVSFEPLRRRKVSY